MASLGFQSSESPNAPVSIALQESINARFAKMQQDLDADQSQLFSAFEARMETKMSGLEGMVAVALQDITCTKESLLIFADELEESLKNTTSPKEKSEDLSMWFRGMDTLREEVQLILKEVSEKKHHVENFVGLEVGMMENAAQILQQFQARDQSFAELKEDLAQVQKELQESLAQQQLQLLEGKSERERQDYKMLDLEAKLSRKVWQLDGAISKFTNCMDTSLGNSLEAKLKSGKLKDKEKDGAKMWSTELTSLRGELEVLRRASHTAPDDRSTQFPSDASDDTMSSGEERSGKQETDTNMDTIACLLTRVAPENCSGEQKGLKPSTLDKPGNAFGDALNSILRRTTEPPKCGTIASEPVRESLTRCVLRTHSNDAANSQQRLRLSELKAGSLRVPARSPVATPRDMRKATAMVGQQAVVLGARLS